MIAFVLSDRAVRGQAVRVGIDGSVQPISLRFGIYHDFIDRDETRVGTVCRL